MSQIFLSTSTFCNLAWWGRTEKKGKRKIKKDGRVGRYRFQQAWRHGEQKRTICMEGSQANSTTTGAAGSAATGNPNSTSNSILSSAPVWPTVDGPLGLSEDESLSHARRFYKFGFAFLPWLWAVNCFYFWPVLRHSSSFPRIRPCNFSLLFFPLLVDWIGFSYATLNWFFL